MLGKEAAFRCYLIWTRDKLQFFSAYCTQMVINLWVGPEDANRRAARLLKFRNRAPNQRDLDSIWGAACDLDLLNVQEHLQTYVADAGAPMIITKDAGLAEMRTFIRSMGYGLIDQDDGERAQVPLVAMSADVHPRLAATLGDLSALIQPLGEAGTQRIAKGMHHSKRLENVKALITECEAALTAGEAPGQGGGGAGN